MPAAANGGSLLWAPGNYRVVGQSLLAIFGLLAVTLITVQVQRDGPSLTSAALAYLVIVVLLSLNGSFTSAAIVSLIAVLLLQDLSTPPLFTLGIDEPLDAVALTAFLTTALIITRLVSKMRGALERLRISLDDLRRAEEAARQQAALLDLTHDSVFVRNTKGRITFWNRGSQELFGWSAAEAVGQTTHELLRTEFPISLEEITPVLYSTGRWEGELTRIRRDNSRIVVASRWSVQRDAHERPIATLETNNDITARKQAENALSRTQAELARVTRITALGELAASIAHEVNQPLTAIVADSNAALNWLAGEKPDLELVRGTLVAIVKDSERAANVLTRIRALLSRSGQSSQPCDLCNIVRDTLPLVRGEFALHAIRVEVSLAAGSPLIMGDAVQLQQVLLNLLINAAEASRDVAAERRVVIVTTDVQHEESQAHVVVKVRDSGVGIRAADLPRVFEAFYTTKSAGLGMGLSVSRAIVERHGGRLWVTANTDFGATSHFSIPAIS
jgi:two-component system, LuxR family, sensor kinase FixL